MKRNTTKSKLESLSAEQRKQLIQWLCVDNLTYLVVNDRVKKEFGISTSQTALSTFWKHYCEPQLLRQKKLQDSFLEITVRVRQGDKILGETEFSVALNTTAQPITFETEIKKP